MELSWVIFLGGLGNVFFFGGGENHFLGNKMWHFPWEYFCGE